MSGALHPSRRIACRLAITGLVSVWGSAFAADDTLQAPNVVAISASLVTSGQPSRGALAKLSAQGFGAVIYLAPPTVANAVPGEADIVRKQGLEFVNIPIEFGNPTEADFQSFVEAMNRLRDRKVLVHCQVNMRASSMTFLYRVIIGRENPEQAYESVARVWSPQGPWRALLVAQLPSPESRSSRTRVRQ
jgi:protein tyrosine phosphatase (PTP) superfamily phosphohydrolase (DUF442 family)